MNINYIYPFHDLKDATAMAFGKLSILGKSIPHLFSLLVGVTKQFTKNNFPRAKRAVTRNDRV